MWLKRKVRLMKHLFVPPGQNSKHKTKQQVYGKLETYLANAQVTFFDRWIFGQVATHIFK